MGKVIHVDFRTPGNPTTHIAGYAGEDAKKGDIVAVIFDDVELFPNEFKELTPCQQMDLLEFAKKIYGEDVKSENRSNRNQNETPLP